MAKRHADPSAVLTVYCCAIVTICMDELYAAQPLWIFRLEPVREPTVPDLPRFLLGIVESTVDHTMLLSKQEITSSLGG